MCAEGVSSYRGRRRGRLGAGAGQDDERRVCSYRLRSPNTLGDGHR